MNTKRNIKAMLAVFTALFVLLAGYLVYIIGAYGPYWFASPYNTRVTNQKNTVWAGSILDRNGVVLAYTNADGEREYAAEESLRLATAHVIGDNSGQTLGAEALFAKYLLGFEQSIGEQLSYLVSGEQRRGKDISLTIDSALCTYASSLLDGNDGAIFLMNYKTGEVLACTASPTFDPARMSEYTTGEYALAEGSMVNRATMGRYTPGSTFKIITTIAALRYLPNVEERTFNCDGPLVFEKESGKLVSGVNPYDEEGELYSKYVLLRDHEDAVHGSLTLADAFAVSCNHVFAEIALEIGEEKLRQTAESLGFNGTFLFDELVAYAGSFGEAQTDFALAWSGVGQHTDILTPIHLCLITSAIANDGVAMEPKLLLQVSGTSTSAPVADFVPEAYQTLLKGNEAEFLASCMRGVVEHGTGTQAAVSGYSVCGKTGTAEISSAENALSHAWFTGYVDSEAFPYAITVIVERAGGGGTIAAPIAAKVLEYAIERSQ